MVMKQGRGNASCVPCPAEVARLPKRNLVMGSAQKPKQFLLTQKMSSLVRSVPMLPAGFTRIGSRSFFRRPEDRLCCIGVDAIERLAGRGMDCINQRDS